MPDHDNLCREIVCMYCEKEFLCVYCFVDHSKDCGLTRFRLCQKHTYLTNRLEEVERRNEVLEEEVRRLLSTDSEKVIKRLKIELQRTGETSNDWIKKAQIQIERAEELEKENLNLRGK